MSASAPLWSMIRRFRPNWHDPQTPQPMASPDRDEGETAALAANGAFGPTAGVLATSWINANPSLSPTEKLLESTNTLAKIETPPLLACDTLPLDDETERTPLLETAPIPTANEQDVIIFPCATLPHPPPVKPPPPAWTLVLSDTDNDFEPVRHVLWLTGLCDIQGCWQPNIPPIRLIHTGDWLNKWNPNPHVLDSFKRLITTAPEGIDTHLLTGNHELAILRMAEMGLQTPFTPEDLHFVRQGSVTHIHDNMLFLHGYPTPSLLKLLQQIQQEGLPLNDINTRLHTAFFQGEHALFRETMGLELTGDIRKPKAYYGQLNPDGTTIGEQVALQLSQLGITTVIHGHKPVTITQTDDELEHLIPGIRVINNDTGVRTTKLGALLISPKGEITFINPAALSAAKGAKPYRKQLRKLLKTRNKNLQITNQRKPRTLRAVAA